MSVEAGEVVVSCREVSAARGRRQVLQGISLELRAGEIVALLGPNGAGKSSLLDVLAGALPPLAGTVERHGRVATALQSPDLARRSVLANVKLALAWWGVPRAEREQRALVALRALGAERLADRAAGSLSGGERRRVHIARAVAVSPDALLLDEPFAGLDAGARASLLEDAASALRSERRATMVVVHDRAEAWALADRLLVLLEGRLVAEGSPQELLERPPTAAVARFLGFDGTVREGAELLLTRPVHVVLDPAGPLDARVERVVPLEDGARLELALTAGRVWTAAALPVPRAGTRVRLRITGGARFAAAEVPDELG